MTQKANMPPTYPYQKMASYPHMKPADVKIWERFIDTHPGYYDTVMYDLTVGTGSLERDHEDESITKSFGMLTARKIDVVGFKDDRIDVVEVKPHAGPSAMGQVLGYVRLYVGYRNPHVEPRAVLLTDSVENDMQYLCAHHGVWLIVV